MIELRPYQSTLVEKIRESYRRGKRAPLVVAPTGAGKTIIFTYISKSAHTQGKRVCILVHRQELLMQTSRALDNFGVPHGLISPQFTPSRNNIQIAAVQTLARRLESQEDFDLIIIDEGHHCVSDTWRKIIARFPRARLLIVTATPERLDGQGLGVQAGGFADDLILGPSVKELISAGFLSPYELYVPPTDLDLSGVKRKMGDFDKKELGVRVDKPKVTGSAVEHYRKICPGAPTLASCVSIAHAEHVAADFRAAGFNFECIHGGLHDSDRKRLVEWLASGRLHGLTFSDLVSEGFDCPAVAALISLRPTQSTSLFLQIVGRALRPFAGKEKAIILDHVGNVFRHGLPDDDRDWSLEGSERSDREKRPSLKVCPRCFGTHEPKPACPLCGFEYPKQEAGRQLEQTEGELKKITAEDKARIAAMRKTKIKNATTKEELLSVARELGYDKNWVWHVMQARKKREQRRGT